MENIFLNIWRKRFLKFLLGNKYSTNSVRIPFSDFKQKLLDIGKRTSFEPGNRLSEQKEANRSILKIIFFLLKRNKFKNAQ